MDHMRSSFGVVIVACLLIAADEAPKLAVNDDAALQGRWTMVELEADGKAVDEKDFKEQTFVSTPSELHIEFKNNRAVYLYTLDASKQSK
jgi:hypothetical protein